MNKRKIEVQGAEISIFSLKEEDYISLTDMVRNVENGSSLIEKRLRNKNTIEFLGIWEEIYNPIFNYPEPLPQASPLWGRPNVIITSHTSWEAKGDRGRDGFSVFLKNLEYYSKNQYD